MKLMKNRLLPALAALFVVTSGSALFAESTQQELIKNRQESIRDWQTVLRVLKKAGYENDPAYIRASTALKKSQTRLEHLQGSKSLTKTAAAGTLATKARGYLEQLGLAGSSPEKSPAKKSEPRKEKVASKTTSKKAPSKVKASSPSKKTTAEKPKLKGKKRTVTAKKA